MPRTHHAKLSPSASARWLNCSGSVAANERTAQAPGRSTHYADEGTAAHALLELCLRLDVEPNKFLGKIMHLDYVVTEDMADAVGHALDWTRAYMLENPGATMYTEHEVDASKFLKYNEPMTGTGDILLDNAPVEMVAVDYKHGAGVAVEIEGNTQTMLYLLGFYAQHGTRPYKQYRHIIIQPRSRHEDGPIREEVITHADLMAFAKRVQKRIIQIVKKPDERTAGSWCNWCAVAGTCRTLADYSLRVAALEFGSEEAPVDPDSLDPDDLAYVVVNVPVIEKWLKAVYGAALQFMLQGGELTGMKLVHGRSSRYWSNEKKVLALLKKRFELDAIAPRSMLGVPGIEKLFKQAKKSMPPVLVNQIARSQPAIHIAPVEDPRTAVTRGEEFLAQPVSASTRKK